MANEMNTARDLAMEQATVCLRSGLDPYQNRAFVSHLEDLRDFGESGRRATQDVHEHILEIERDPRYFERQSPIEKALTALGLSMDDADGNMALTMMREQVVRALAMVPASTQRHTPDLATQASRWLCGPRGQDVWKLEQAQAKQVEQAQPSAAGDTDEGPALKVTMVHLPVLHRADFSVNDGDLNTLLREAHQFSGPNVLIGPWQTSTSQVLDDYGIDEVCRQYGVEESDLEQAGWRERQDASPRPAP